MAKIFDIVPIGRAHWRNPYFRIDVEFILTCSSSCDKIKVSCAAVIWIISSNHFQNYNSFNRLNDSHSRNSFSSEDFTTYYSIHGKSKHFYEFSSTFIFRIFFFFTFIPLLTLPIHFPNILCSAQVHFTWPDTLWRNDDHWSHCILIRLFDIFTWFFAQTFWWRMAACDTVAISIGGLWVLPLRRRRSSKPNTKRNSQFSNDKRSIVNTFTAYWLIFVRFSNANTPRNRSKIKKENRNSRIHRSTRHTNRVTVKIQ